MGKGSSRGFHPSGLPGFLGICCLIALVLSGIDIFLGSGSGHLLPDLSVVIPAMSIFAVLLTACALGLSLPILLYGRWSGGRPVSWRAGETLFVFIVVYLFIEYHLMGELVGWADLDASGIHLSPHIHLREEATAFIVASMSATLAYYLMSRFFRSLIALLLAAAILLPMLAGRASSRRHTGRGGGRGNVILVTIDTLRADFLGCYGSEHARTPFIDSLARGGILFERAYTASSLTGPSHASLMTSLYPRSHGLLYNGWSIDPAIETLPRILRSAGYRTGAIIHALPLDRKYGFERGFDYFLSAYKEETFTLAVLERTQLLSLIYDQPHRRGGHVIELASSWLRRYSGEPFFLWIHLYDVHEPYSPPAGFVDPAIAGARYPEAVAEGRADPTEANIERLRGLYSGEVRYVDYLLGELWGLLQRLGSTEGTCLVVTSDHGEELLDHGSNVGHARFLYRSVCHVPLIIYNAPLADRAPRRIPDIVRTVDIMPTILDLLGLEIPEEIQGESLLPLLEDGKPSTDYAVSETYQERGSLFKLSLIEGTRHLISGSGPGEEELFDLARDPGEARNLAAESPGPLAALERRLERWTETTPVRNVQDSMKLKAEDIEALKALGYLQ